MIALVLVPVVAVVVYLLACLGYWQAQRKAAGS